MNLLEYFKDKKIYFFGDNDLDGISSRVIAQYYIQPIVKELFITCDNDRQMTNFNMKYAEQSDIIIFTDIAPTKELFLQLT